MIKGVAIALLIVLVLAAALLAYAATKPKTFRITRSTLIGAPPERITALLTDFRRWIAWSPWEHRDPQLKRAFGGPDTGVDATYAWEGNRSVGAGRMQILEAQPMRVLIALEFLRPFRVQNTSEFTLEPEGETTRVTWTMEGPALFVGKVMGMFMDMDTMIGRDFETGLANLKREAERG